MYEMLYPYPEKNQLYLLNGYSRLSMHLMVVLRKKKFNLYPVDFHKLQHMVVLRHILLELPITLLSQESYLLQHPKGRRYTKWMLKLYS